MTTRVKKKNLVSVDWKCSPELFHLESKKRGKILSTEFYIFCPLNSFNCLERIQDYGHRWQLITMKSTILFRSYIVSAVVIYHGEVVSPRSNRFKKPSPWPVSIASQTGNDLRNGYSSELLSLWWLIEKI
jgi:hypothetical protein